MQPAIRRIDRYQLYPAFASGGMATIHLARQVGAVGPGRIVAIKRLQEAYARDQGFREMFLDEARITSGLDHPNVVRTLEVVSTEGELMIVMELIRGDAFSRLLAACQKFGEQVPLPIVSAIVGGALDGLHAAHEALAPDGRPLHVVHRDVSPHNILVGADGLARIADFGIAKALGRSHVTRTGEIKGKLSFMAPEQIRAEDDVDRRADVYAIGVVLWEAVTARRLFPGQDASVMFQVLQEEPASPARYRPDLPPALEALILRALSKDRSARFGTAVELARALEAAAPPARPREVGEWVKRLAGDNMERQSSMIRAAEAGEPMTDPATPQPLDRTFTSTASGVSSRTTTFTPSKGGGSRAVWFVAAAALGLGGAIGGGAFWFMSATPAPAPASRAGETAPPRPVESSAPAASSTGSALATSEPAEVPQPSASASASAGAEHTPPRPVRAPARPPSPTPSPNPAQPYTYEF